MISAILVPVLFFPGVRAQQPGHSLGPNGANTSGKQLPTFHEPGPALTATLNAATETVAQSINGSIFSLPEGRGWSIRVRLSKAKVESQSIAPGSEFLSLGNEDGEKWLAALESGGADNQRIDFQLHTDYNPDPLIVGVPVKLLPTSSTDDFLLRYEDFHLSLLLNGVQVDEEWPVGKVKTGTNPQLRVTSPVTQLSIWSLPLSDADVIQMNGGVKRVAAEADEILGPESQRIQYSRPRGYNTNAGDAMPFYHDGTFHLFFLFDRRQHHSKWRLGAHQWAHVSSTDLIHWKHDRLALSIDHEWEGSICTGSIFFHDGQYYGHYATRMPDRSERLAVALSPDAIHFKKTLPTPFAEPQPPFIRGPNRDPFVFQVGNQFHMLVTAAIANGRVKNEGALEHLTSTNLKDWTVVKEPFITSRSTAQPECSDLFNWKGSELYELPVSYWSDGHQWINSPGYPDGSAIFDRAVFPRCLECHTTFVLSTLGGNAKNSYVASTLIVGITCETQPSHMISPSHCFRQDAIRWR